MNYSFIWFFTFDSGLGILNPTAHDYEDLFADGILKICVFGGEKHGRVYTRELKYDKNDNAYIKFRRKRWYLDDATPIRY